MILRIVKLEFLEGNEHAFLEIFEEVQMQIKGFEGCHSLELLRENTGGTTFFTISKWDSEGSLEKYRNSTLFQNTWQRTKALFSSKAQAWTTESIAKIG